MIRYGIIGAGNIARKFARDITFSPNSELVAVASRSIEKAQDFATEFSIPKAYGSYEEIVQDPYIDAIYVATPHNFHREHSILAMTNNKHVLCEKPISVNRIELEDMIQVAQENKVLLMEAMWTRFLEATTYMKELIESKKYGELNHVTLRFGFDRGDYPKEGRLLNPALAGGSILDLLIYPVSSLLFYTDSPIKIMNVDAKVDGGVDLDTTVEIELENGTKASLQSSIDQELDSTGVFQFEEKTVLLPRFYYGTEVLIDSKHIELPTNGDGFTNQIIAFSKTIENGLLQNEIHNYEEMKKVMTVLDQVRKQLNIVYPCE